MIKEIAEQIIDNLNLGDKSVFGLDIGLSAIKTAEVSRPSKGRVRLNKFSIVALPEGALLENEVQAQDEVIECIANSVDEAGIKSKNVTTGLFGPNTVVKKLQLAGGTYDEISDQVHWEIEQFLPFSIDDANISFDIIGENEGGGIDIMVVAARQDIVQNLKELIILSGHKLKILEMRQLAIVNVFNFVMQDELYESDDTWIILDIGAQKCQFIVFKLGSVVFSKEINFGSVIITEEIQRRMGVNYYEAEDLKINVDQSGNLPEEIAEIVDEVLDGFIDELKKSLEFYTSNFSDESIVGCKATGGTCRAAGLLEKIEKALGVDVSILNPFDIIEYDQRSIDEDDIEEIAYRGVVALGYAMREIGK